MTQDQDHILSAIFEGQELTDVLVHQQVELMEYDIALNIVKGMTFGSNSLLRWEGDVTPDKISVMMIGAIGGATHFKVEPFNTRFIQSKMNGKNFTLQDGKLAQQETHTLPDLFPKGQKDKWPKGVVFSANSSLVSPIAFAHNLVNAGEVGNAYLGTNAVVTGINDKDTAGKVVVIGSYQSKDNLFDNIQDNVSRFHIIRSARGDGLQKMDKTSRLEAMQLLDLISVRDANGNVAMDDGYRVIRNDSADILQHVIGYGHSAAATKNHDAIRYLRNMIETSQLKIEDVPLNRHTTEADAKIIGNVTLISAGGPNLTYTNGKAVEPKCLAYLSYSDGSASFPGNAAFKDNNAIIVTTDKKDLHGHGEKSYVEAIKKHLAEQQSKQL